MKRRLVWITLVLLGLALVLTGGCAKASTQSTSGKKSAESTATAGESAMMTVTVTQADKAAIPKDALVSVKLVDVSKADAPGVVIAEKTVMPSSQMPINVKLEYDAKAIDPSHTYVVQVSIKDTAGKVLYTTPQPSPALTNKAPVDTVTVVVAPV